MKVMDSLIIKSSQQVASTATKGWVKTVWWPPAGMMSSAALCHVLLESLWLRTLHTPISKLWRGCGRHANQLGQYCLLCHSLQRVQLNVSSRQQILQISSKCWFPTTATQIARLQRRTVFALLMLGAHMLSKRMDSVSQILNFSDKCADHVIIATMLLLLTHWPQCKFSAWHVHVYIHLNNCIWLFVCAARMS